jgi:hypothetical protein
MSMKIGELLVQRAVIDEAKLQDALNAQLVYGGHLGTCLIELGHVDENDLGHALAEIFGVGYATAEMLNDITQPVIDCVPRRIVEKHGVIPFHVTDGTLHVAMIDPKNISALDETAFVTGCRTQPWIAPEIRVFQAMERYYGIPRRLRFVGLCRELDHERPFAPKSSPADPHTQALRGGSSDPVQSACTIGAGAGEETSVSRGLEDLGEEFGYGRSWREIVGVDERGTPSPTVAAQQPESLPVRGAPLPGIAVPSLDEAADRMCQAESLDQLSCALLDFAGHRTPRCILWRVDSIEASIWDWRGFALDKEEAQSLRVQVTSEPIFRLVAGAGCYRGPVPNDPGYHRFYHMLGAAIPLEILMFPVYLNDHLVALFYGDCGTLPSMQADTDDYRRAMVKLAYALTLLQLKQTIRSI